MPARGAHHVDLAVTDVDRSVAFHLGLLGPLGLEEDALPDLPGAPRRSCTSATATSSSACGVRTAASIGTTASGRAHRSSPLSGRPTRMVSEKRPIETPTATRSASEVLRSRRGSSPPARQRPTRRWTRSSGATPPVRWRYHPSRIFQKLSLRTILPSSPNVHRSHPRTSTRTPLAGGAADRPFRDPPIPAREVIVVPIVDVRDALKARRKPATHLVLSNEASSPSFGPPRGLEYAVLVEVRHDRVEVALVEAAQHLPKHLCLPPGEHGLLPAPKRVPDAVR